VLCSDGLSGPVADREIGAVVSTLPPKEACRFLIDLANLQGGPDNITVIVIKVVKGDDKSDTTAAGAEGEDALDNHKPHKRPHGQPWYQLLPWTLLLMALGIVLALGAIAVAYAHRSAGIVMFVLAALAFGVGLVGLWLQNRGEQQPSAEDQDADRELRIHRQVACDIELPLLHKLAKAEAALEVRIRDHNWPADWDDCKKHSAQAQQHMSKGALTEAFREYCRAMLPLSEAVQRHRQKEELFKPLWDKNSD
jgi:hypothetical protein